MEKKLFLGFGILTVLSGLYFIVQQEYLQGICGASVGVLLLVQNREQTKEEDKE